jgi:hypothetical protein
MEGIEKLKAALGAVIKLAKVTDTALDDKKITVIEGLKIGVASFQVWLAVKDFDTLKAEYADLDETEKDELVTYFVTEFDLNEDDIEEIIEEIFTALMQLAGLSKKIV